jgi:hypothetical protein
VGVREREPGSILGTEWDAWQKREPPGRWSSRITQDLADEVVRRGRALLDAMGDILLRDRLAGAAADDMFHLRALFWRWAEVARPTPWEPIWRSWHLESELLSAAKATHAGRLSSVELIVAIDAVANGYRHELQIQGLPEREDDGPVCDLYSDWSRLRRFNDESGYLEPTGQTSRKRVPYEGDTPERPAGSPRDLWDAEVAAEMNLQASVEKRLQRRLTTEEQALLRLDGEARVIRAIAQHPGIHGAKALIPIVKPMRRETVLKIVSKLLAQRRIVNRGTKARPRLYIAERVPAPLLEVRGGVRVPPPVRRRPRQ